MTGVWTELAGFTFSTQNMIGINILLLTFCRRANLPKCQTNPLMFFSSNDDLKTAEIKKTPKNQQVLSRTVEITHFKERIILNTDQMKLQIRSLDPKRSLKCSFSTIYLTMIKHD